MSASSDVNVGMFWAHSSRSASGAALLRIVS